MRLLSLNRQDFARVIEDGCIYVDKTEQIHRLVTTDTAYFLSRPRRFGKSLLVNTLKELFLGNRELFRGTWIHDKLEWNAYPVVKLDFSRVRFRELGMDRALTIALDEVAEEYGVSLDAPDTGGRLDQLIVRMHRKLGQVVILVDEYDKPIVDYITDIDTAEAHREKLKSFYSCLKPLGAMIRFLFITGVSKFSKVSIFSELNHLTDITIEPDYAGMLGYTIQEVEQNFGEYLGPIEKRHGYDRATLIARMQKQYNGYSWDGETFVYNPFSLQRFLTAKVFQHFWFATGTSTFLVKALRDLNEMPEKIAPREVTESFFDTFELRAMDIYSLLFQTGYLTIKRVDPDLGIYTLDWPNGEVEFAFLNNLLEVWSARPQSGVSEIMVAITRSVEDGDPDVFIDAFDTLFSGIPYDHFQGAGATEGVFASNVYIVLKILGVRENVEVHTAEGRIDGVIEGRNHIFIAEFKIGTAEEAMEQIRRKRYDAPYAGGGKPVHLLAIGFDAQKRRIASRIVAEAPG